MGYTNRWDERYSADGYVFGTEPNGFLADTVPRLRVGRALCIADGEGRNSVFLAERGFTVTAMDASAIGMRKATTLAMTRNVGLTTHVADLESYDFGNARWDAIVSIFCHLPPELRRRVHARVAAALLPEGVFVLEAYTPRQLEYGTGGPSDAQLLMTVEDLQSELTGLELQIARETVRDVVEGRGHTGRASVVQILAVKPAEPRGE
ncbi:MAG: class I SAM-dependent methyltransferase [Spirochaetaceae bacterium]|nr:MAG: class I SAM-dependent methyltransferase [Spirochaetaceae bacterium]